jgi:hypothetical protein
MIQVTRIHWEQRISRCENDSQLESSPIHNLGIAIDPTAAREWQEKHGLKGAMSHGSGSFCKRFCCERLRLQVTAGKKQSMTTVGSCQAGVTSCKWALVAACNAFYRSELSVFSYLQESFQLLRPALRCFNTGNFENLAITGVP